MSVICRVHVTLVVSASAGYVGLRERDKKSSRTNARNVSAARTTASPPIRAKPPARLPSPPDEFAGNFRAMP